MLNNFKKGICLFVVMIFVVSGSLSVSAESTLAPTNKIFYDAKNAPQVTVVNYHHFGYEGEYPSIENIRIEPEIFKAQLQKLKDQGYKTITQKQLINYLNGTGRVPKKSLLITIDDGFESVYTYAYPILKELDMNAVFFPIISEIEDGERLGAPMISWKQLKKIAKSDVMEIGNHTYDLHWRGNNDSVGSEAMVFGYDKKGNPLTDKQRKKWIKADLSKAERIYKKKTGLKMTKAISYPYGAYDNITLQVAKELGYVIGYTVVSGPNLFGSGADNMLEVNRFGVRYPHDENFVLTRITSQTNQANVIYDNRDLRVSTEYKDGVNKFTVNTESTTDYSNIENIRFEIWKMKGKNRTYVGLPSVSNANLTSSQPTFTFTEKFNKKSAYQKHGRDVTYSMKVILTAKDGTSNIEWVNYKFK